MKQEQAKTAVQLWKRVSRMSHVFALCPFVRMIAVSNSLAFGRATPQSDIDLFIITKTSHLYTAQFFMKVLTQIFGLRVHHEKIAGRFCLSFFVTERARNLEPLALEFDPHLAEFVKTMKPILGKDAYLRFLDDNEGWVSRHTHEALLPDFTYYQSHSFASALRVLSECILFIFSIPFEFLFAKIQAKKDEERRKNFPGGSIVITRDVYKFHENDPRGKIAETLLKQ